jgi:hypothetical protein
MTPTHTTPPTWLPERIDRLARAMYPLIFGRAAPAPAPTNVAMLADYRRLARPR